MPATLGISQVTVKNLNMAQLKLLMFSLLDFCTVQMNLSITGVR